MKITPAFLKPLSLPQDGSGPYGSKKPVRYEGRGSIKKFEKSRDGKRMQRQFREGIDQLKTFLHANHAPRAETAAESLDTFCGRIAEGSTGHYSTQIRHLYDEGKASLDALCTDVKNDDIPLSKRILVVENLAEGVIVCSEGTLSNLVMASQELRMSTAGLKGHAKKAWKDMLDHVLLQYCRAKHSGREGYVSKEIHYVNGYRNLLADEYGVDTQADAFVPSEEISENVSEVTEYVRERVTANALLRCLAESCLSEVREHFKGYAGRPLSADEAWQCYQEYEKSLEALLHGRYGRIDPSLLVSDSEGKGTEDAPYTLIAEPALLMRAIARNMKDAGLFEKEKFQVVSRKTRRDPATKEQSEVTIKRIMDDAFYMKEKAKNGEVSYRTAQLSDLANLASVPLKLLEIALSNADPDCLRQLSVKDVWRIIFDDSSMDWIANLSLPAVRRYRQASPRNNESLERWAIEQLRASHTREMRAALPELMRNGEARIANAVARHIGGIFACGSGVSNWTLLLDAVESGTLEVAKILVRECGADINRQTPTRRLTALMVAADRGNVDMIKLLVPASDLTLLDDRNRTVLMRAVENGNSVSLDALLAAGADPSYESPQSESDEHWQASTALTMAVVAGNRLAIQRLLEAGADVNKKSHGWSPLALAAKAGHVDLVRLLLPDADRDSRNGPLQKTPLLLALEAGHGEVARVLMEGANPELLRRDRQLHMDAWQPHDHTDWDLMDEIQGLHPRHTYDGSQRRQVAEPAGRTRRRRFGFF